MGPYSCLSYMNRMCLRSCRDLCMVHISGNPKYVLHLQHQSLRKTKTKDIVLFESWKKRHKIQDQLEENGLKHWKHLVLLFYLVKNIPLLVSSTRFMIVINARYIFLAPMSQLEIFFFFALLLEKAPQVAPSSGNGH